MRIAQITDIHLDDFLADHYKVDSISRMDTVLNDIKEAGTDRIVVTGDMGQYESFDVIADKINKTGIEWYYLLGNHDEPENYMGRPEGQKWGTNGALYFSRTVGDDLFLFLDTHASLIDRVQNDWIKQALSSHRFNRLIIFSHHPILDCGGCAMDLLYPLKNKESLSDLFRGREGVYIFCGHYHTVHEQIRGNLFQYVTPSLMVQLEKETDKIELASRDYGYRLIDIVNEEITTSVRMFPDHC